MKKGFTPIVDFDDVLNLSKRSSRASSKFTTGFIPTPTFRKQHSCAFATHSESGCRGFTLIELLVVVGIIGILSAVVIASLSSVRDKARVTGGKQFEANVYHSAGDMMIGEWRFDEGTGNNANDTSGFNSIGNISGATWSTDTPNNIKNSLRFDGIDDNVAIPYTSRLAPTQAISVGAWFKTENIGTNQSIISKTESGGFNIHLNNGCTGYVCVLLNVGGTYYSIQHSISGASADKWYYVLFSYDGETIKLYFDGKEVASNTNPSGNISYLYNNPFCIGGEATGSSCSGSGVFFLGKIDNVRVYEKALVAKEVENIYLAERDEYKILVKGD